MSRLIRPGLVSWDAVAGDLAGYYVFWSASGGGSSRSGFCLEDCPPERQTFQLPAFDYSLTWQVEVFAVHAVNRAQDGLWSDPAIWAAVTATPTPLPATETPAASYRSRVYQNRTVYEADSCADRQEFRRCTQTCLRADADNCWGLSCGPWLVGVAAPDSCPTPEGAPAATATAVPSGSVSCENAVIDGEDALSCEFTLHDSGVGVSDGGLDGFAGCRGTGVRLQRKRGWDAQPRRGAGRMRDDLGGPGDCLLHDAGISGDS